MRNHLKTKENHCFQNTPLCGRDLRHSHITFHFINHLNWSQNILSVNIFFNFIYLNYCKTFLLTSLFYVLIVAYISHIMCPHPIHLVIFESEVKGNKVPCQWKTTARVISTLWWSVLRGDQYSMVISTPWWSVLRLHGDQYSVVISTPWWSVLRGDQYSVSVVISTLWWSVLRGDQYSMVISTPWWSVLRLRGD